MDDKELKIILEKHKLWLENKKEGVRANLQDINLRNADLRNANLQDANLRYANLQDANLRYANLRNANLQDADLQNANLQDANLQDANLRYANLRNANLQDADLQNANLRYANLQDADLQDADLDFSCFPLWCGSFDIVDDGHIAKQLLSHIVRLDIKDKKLAKWVKTIPKEYRNEFCERHDIEEI